MPTQHSPARLPSSSSQNPKGKPLHPPKKLFWCMRCSYWVKSPPKANVSLFRTQKQGYPVKGHLRKPLSSRSLLVFAFNFVFFNIIIRGKGSAPTSKAFWQDQNTSVSPQAFQKIRFLQWFLAESFDCL